MNLDIFLKRRHQLFAHELGAEENPKSKKIRFLLGFFVLAVILGVCALIMSRPPKDFPLLKNITIAEGSALSEIADVLVEENVIRSRYAFITASSFLGKASKLKAGDYRFENPRGMLGVVRALANGEHGDVSVRFKTLEGWTLTDIAREAAGVFNDFNEDDFMNEAIGFNGYLFPDTYFVLPAMDEKEIVSMMHDNFSETLNDVGSSILSDVSPEKLREIVIMASIIEREAFGFEDAYIISGILWKRIEIGMPLQVDASFAYLFDKASSELTLADLAYDSPYNTYTNRGLPPGPLGNPGKIALDAALNPAESPYLFYLHAPDGSVHYGKTHDDHVNNKNKYLR